MPTDAINKVIIVTNGAKLRPVQIANSQLAELITAASSKRDVLMTFGHVLVRPSEIDALEVTNAS